MAAMLVVDRRFDGDEWWETEENGRPLNSANFALPCGYLRVICYLIGKSDQLKVKKFAFSLVLIQLICKIKWINWFTDALAHSITPHPNYFIWNKNYLNTRQKY
jgi:hypothetical protein